MMRQHIAPDAACQICNEMHIYLETLEETVNQALHRLEKEREAASNNEENAQEGVRTLEISLRTVMTKLQTLTSTIASHRIGDGVREQVVGDRW
jgi:hypothetical protein